MMNNITLYPAHSDAQVANAAKAYQHSDLLSIIYYLLLTLRNNFTDSYNLSGLLSQISTEMFRLHLSSAGQLSSLRTSSQKA
jgi:hypothetical protein